MPHSIHYRRHPPIIRQRPRWPCVARGAPVLLAPAPAIGWSGAEAPIKRHGKWIVECDWIWLEQARKSAISSRVTLQIFDGTFPVKTCRLARLIPLQKSNSRWINGHRERRALVEKSKRAWSPQMTWNKGRLHRMAAVPVPSFFPLDPTPINFEAIPHIYPQRNRPTDPHTHTHTHTHTRLFHFISFFHDSSLENLTCDPPPGHFNAISQPISNVITTAMKTKIMIK